MTKLSTVEMQQAIRVNLFHILQAPARAENSGVPAKGLTGQAYEGQYFWDEVDPIARTTGAGFLIGSAAAPSF